MRRRIPGRVRAAGLLLAATVLAGCAAGAQASTPTWVPQPAYTLEPVPGGAQGTGTSPTPTPGVPSSTPGQTPSTGGTPAGDPAVVATGLNAPTGIAILPSGIALVGERTTGRILLVQPTAGQPVRTIRTLTGLSTSGDGGLLDLALSPHFDEDGLIYAYITTPTDNRVVDFTLNGPATPVVTGIPSGASDNRGRLAFDAAGNLLISTSDAGQAALAQNSASLAGKILYVNDIGQPAAGSSSVLAQGQHVADGVCVDPDSGRSFVVGPAGTTQSDEVNLVERGRDLGWSDGTKTTAGAPLATMPANETSPGDCAVTGGVLYVTSLDGKALLAAGVTVSSTGVVTIGTFNVTLSNKYGRLLTVTSSPDGSLWLTTSNKDGHGTPAANDERVLHITPSGGGAGSNL